MLATHFQLPKHRNTCSSLCKSGSSTQQLKLGSTYFFIFFFFFVGHKWDQLDWVVLAWNHIGEIRDLGWSQLRAWLVASKMAHLQGCWQEASICHWLLAGVSVPHCESYSHCCLRFVAADFSPSKWSKTEGESCSCSVSYDLIWEVRHWPLHSILLDHFSQYGRNCTRARSWRGGSQAAVLEAYYCQTHIPCSRTFLNGQNCQYVLGAQCWGWEFLMLTSLLLYLRYIKPSTLSGAAKASQK